MKKKLIWATALLVCAMLFVSACGTKETTEEEQKDVTEKLVSRDWEVIKEEGTLKVATSGTYFPNSYHDEESNELTGFEVEILREIANRLGLEVEFTEMGVDGMLTSLNSEQIDIAALGIDRDGENADKYNFTIPYKYSFGSMVVREEDNSGIEKLEDLKGKKAAGAATTSYMKVAEKFGAELVIYDNATNDQYLWDVANGRTDVVLNDYYGQLMATEALPEIPVKVHDVFYNPSETNYAIKLGNDEFTKQINAQLEAMHDDGTLSEISKQFYNGEDVTVQKDYEFQEIDVSEE
ncbi:transporter substrate-binding domain-containing protein [Desemzia sp. C1]|uniref:Cystine transport system substrate-binding protein n=1 Tax=Desemzia incerta TaxID=82801 RepID=A0A1I5YLE1_9LACT|nr:MULTISPECIES: transporter substrate-binding domain-containing protein [Desemzia]MCI3028899.1 transporter substrate-binding domain-containing protein [Desemzia sp. C1]SFQ45008.1 cystine transport system substrate-binding protein [Desemzia incerta]